MDHDGVYRHTQSGAYWLDETILAATANPDNSMSITIVIKNIYQGHNVDILLDRKAAIAFAGWLTSQYGLGAITDPLGELNDDT